MSAERLRRPRRGSSRAAGGRARVAVERRLGRVGLDRDHAHAVGDDVVQLARDPRPLLGDRGVRAPLALALEVPGQLAQPLGLLVLAAHDAPDERGADRR